MKQVFAWPARKRLRVSATVVIDQLGAQSCSVLSSFFLVISLSVDPGKVQSRKVASPMRMALISRNAAQKKSSKLLISRRILKINVKKKAIFTFTQKQKKDLKLLRVRTDFLP